jgi:putative restriction endonuclease
MLPSLLRKAAGDAGFDLVVGEDGEWARLAVSGLGRAVWIVPVGLGALVALETGRLLGDFSSATWTDVPLPAGAAGAVRCRDAEETYQTLRRVRILLAQQPPRPEEELKRRLEAVTTTEAQTVVRRRVGQDLFREMLLEYWDGRCAVTGLAVKQLLRASHAKPWKDASDAERLDVHNGFLLAVHLDALFDQGLITFEDDGALRVSPSLPKDARELFLATGVLRLRRIAARHLRYLKYHREHVFELGEGGSP